MLIRRADHGDVPRIVALRRERTAWLLDRGSDQWSVGLPEDGFICRVRDSINNGNTWVIEHEVSSTALFERWHGLNPSDRS